MPLFQQRSAGSGLANSVFAELHARTMPDVIGAPRTPTGYTSASDPGIACKTCVNGMTNVPASQFAIR